MSKMVTVRLDDGAVSKLEQVRDQARFPTQSDFIREAVRRMIREERRRAVALEVRELARDEQEMALLRAYAASRMASLNGEESDASGVAQ